MEEVRPRCIEWLLRKFSAISEDDAEDCVDEAFEGVRERSSESVKDVYNYLFSSAKYKALDLIQERKYRVSFDSEWLTSAVDERLYVVAEAVLDEELTVRVDQLRRLFALAFSKLAPNRRRLVELWLEGGVRSSNEVLAKDMDISNGALKSLKSRTLSDLRDLLPTSADELGIDFQHVLNPPPEVLSARPSLPSEENGEGSG